MSGPDRAAGQTVWRRLVAAHITYDFDERRFNKALSAFLAPGVDRVGLVRRALRAGEKATAIFVLDRLSRADLQALFAELVYWVSTGHGAIRRVRAALLSLPRGWVLERIEAEAEPLLRAGTDDEFRRFLELYVLLGDRDLSLRLAHRAAVHADPDIREAGEDFLRVPGKEDSAGHC